MKAYIPDQTRLTQVHLRTARLDALLDFYSSVLGLNPSHSAGGPGILSAGPSQPGLVLLSEDPKAAPRPPRSVGLYHFALRYPTRKNLAQIYRRIVEAGYPIAGASDHGVSEAIYLSDPDGNGIELYADRPRSRWHWDNGQVKMVTRALALDELLSVASPGATMTEPRPEPDLGHIHLNVADLAASERFYSEFLGFSVTQRSYAGALFFAADGYHHHVAVNLWSGRTAADANSVGLVSYRFEVPVSEILYCLDHRAPLLGYKTRMAASGEHDPILQIRDPNGTWLEVEPTSMQAACCQMQEPPSEHHASLSQ
jgi:catechol 2,3-dioxygenase